MKLRQNLGSFAVAIIATLAVSSANALTITSSLLNPPIPTAGTAANTLTGTLVGTGSLTLTSGSSSARSPWTNALVPATGDQQFASVTNGSITYDLKAAGNFGTNFPGASKVELIWGSPDTYNTLQLFNGGNVVASIIPGVTANVPFISGNTLTASYLITISGVLFDKIVFSSTQAAFEFANVEVTAVPLPAAAWLFISALGGLVLVGRRRRMQAVAA